MEGREGGREGSAGRREVEGWREVIGEGSDGGREVMGDGGREVEGGREVMDGGK